MSRSFVYARFRRFLRPLFLAAREWHVTVDSSRLSRDEIPLAELCFVQDRSKSAADLLRGNQPCNVIQDTVLPADLLRLTIFYVEKLQVK